MYLNIDAERVRNGMTKAMFAERLGVSYSTLKSWMAGRTDIPASKLIEMTRMFHVKSDYLLGIDNNESA